MLCCARLNRKVARRSFVCKFCHRTLLSKSVILWIYGTFNTTGNSEKTKLNHDDISDLQVGALERGPSSRLAIPSWMTIQNIFSKLELVFSEFPVVLNSLNSKISKFRDSSCFEQCRIHAGLTAWPMLNVYNFKLGKENLKPRIGTTLPLH